MIGAPYFVSTDQISIQIEQLDVTSFHIAPEKIEKEMWKEIFVISQGA